MIMVNFLQCIIISLLVNKVINGSVMDKDKYLKSWDNENVVKYFASNRNTLTDVYPSERYFLDKYLNSDMKVLDYGCAAGGFCNILNTAYNISLNNYWGVDQSLKMVEMARSFYKKAHFSTSISEVIKDNIKFDLVFSFGVLHMTFDWEKILRALYDLTLKYMIFDLRVVDDKPTIEDISRSYQTLGSLEAGNDQDDAALKVPYVVLNKQDLAKRLDKIFKKSDSMFRYGYYHPVSETVNSPYESVEMVAFCVVKQG